MKIIVSCALILVCARLQGEDPKIGASREEVIRLLGEPRGRVGLRDGGAIFSFSRGDVTFDKTKAIKVDLVSEQQAEATRQKELADREAMAQRNAPGGKGYLEKKKQDLESLLGQFYSSKVPGNPVADFVHKSSACFSNNQYSPEGPRGLTVSFQVGSDGSLAILTRYIGFWQGSYNQIGISLGQDDFMSHISKEISKSPIPNTSSSEELEICIFRGQAVDEFVREINSNPGKKVTIMTYNYGKLVEPNLHPGVRVNNPPSYVLTDSDKRALKKSVELSDTLKVLRDVK